MELSACTAILFSVLGSEFYFVEVIFVLVCCFGVCKGRSDSTKNIAVMELRSPMYRFLACKRFMFRVSSDMTLFYASLHGNAGVS